MKNFWVRDGAISLALHAVLLLILLIGLERVPHAPHASLRFEITAPTTNPTHPKEAHSRTSPPDHSSKSAPPASAPQSYSPPSSNSASTEEALPSPVEDFQVTQMPELSSEIRIPYPPDSKARGIQGAVVMDILIDSKGRVRDAILIEGPAADLNNAALKAVRGFEFKPARVEEKSVAVRIRYAYRFVIEP